MIELALGCLCETAHSSSLEAGWWYGQRTDDIYVIATKLALIHSEVSEALEGARKGLQDDHLPHRTMLEVELADVVIRVADLSGALGLDLGGAVMEKLLYNRQRQDHTREHRAATGGKKI